MSKWKGHELDKYDAEAEFLLSDDKWFAAKIAYAEIHHKYETPEEYFEGLKQVLEEEEKLFPELIGALDI